MEMGYSHSSFDIKIQGPKSKTQDSLSRRQGASQVEEENEESLSQFELSQSVRPPTGKRGAWPNMDPGDSVGDLKSSLEYSETQDNMNKYLNNPKKRFPGQKTQHKPDEDRLTSVKYGGKGDDGAIEEEIEEEIQ